MSSVRRKFWSIVLVGGLALLVVVPIGLLYFGTSGMVFGEEFSPDDFSRRKFQYNVAPLFNVPIRGISYTNSTPVLEQTLVSDGLITAGKTTTWDLVYDSVSEIGNSRSFDARFLTDYLDLQNQEGDNLWLAWNADHPKSCVVFWKTVAELARDQMYWSIPPIMRRAMETEKDGDPDFDRFLAERAAAAFLEEGSLTKSEGDLRRAIRLFSQSIDHQPSRLAYQQRGQCHLELGDSSLHQRDLDAAQQLID